MYGTILVPTDGSDGIGRALDHAVEIGRGRNATIHALSVIDRRVYLSATDDEQQAEITETLQERADRAVACAGDRLEEAGLAVETVVRDGVPHAEILRYGDEIDADLIVMGTHGRTGREKIANLGSVTERVVEEADRPVLVVDIGDE